MSPFEHGEVFVLDDGGEVCKAFKPARKLLHRGLSTAVLAGGPGFGQL